MTVKRTACALVALVAATLSFPRDGVAQPAGPTPPAPAGIVDDLVSGSRILADLGVVDAFGHLSARSPADPNRFLMSRSVAPALVTPDDIMEFDLDGNPIDGRGRAVFLERFIHAQIYRARPDVMAVVHSHSDNVIPFGVVRVPLVPVIRNAAFLGGGVPVFDTRDVAGDTDMLVRSNELGAALAHTLGGRSVALLRGHGDVVVGSSIPTAVFRAYYTDVNARLQLAAKALGGDITALTGGEAQKADVANAQIQGRAWELWKLKAGSRR